MTVQLTQRELGIIRAGLAAHRIALGERAGTLRLDAEAVALTDKIGMAEHYAIECDHMAATR